MPGIVTNQDYTKQINDAFAALKYASPQQLQAVAQQVQGNPQSPEALALAMATQFQQEARQPNPTPPQGTVLQQKLASIAPQGPGIGAVAPNQMAFNQAAQQDPMRNAGIGAAPENTPQMATGGLVSLAHGGPVQGYAGGGSTYQLPNDLYDTMSSMDSAEQPPDFSYMDESPSSQMPKIDLASLGSTRNTPPSGDGGQTIVVDTGDEPTPTAMPTAERTSGGSSSKVPKLSFDKQVEGLASLFAGDHAKAAELKGAMEKRLAESSRSHNLEDVAAGIAGMLSSRGYMSQRLGAGALMGLASRGRHGDEEDALQGKIDALGLNEETQSNAARHEALKSIIGAQAKSAEMQQEQLNKLAQLDFERRTKFGEHNIQGQWGVQREGVQGKNAQTLQEAKAKEDRLLAAFEHKLKTTENLTQKDILTAYSNVAGHFASSDLGYTPEEIRNKIAPYMGPYASMLPGGTPPAPAQQLGNGLSLSGTPTTP